MFILEAVRFSFPFPLSIFLSVSQTELSWSVLLPFSGLRSDKTTLSTWPGRCYAENLVYGPSAEYKCPFQSPTTTETVQSCSGLFVDIREPADTG